MNQLVMPETLAGLEIQRDDFAEQSVARTLTVASSPVGVSTGR
jgi:hypothetical protein